MDPEKFISTEKPVLKPILPYSSIQIYASLEHFKYGIRSILALKESARDPLLRSLVSLFANAAGQPADLLGTVSVRTAWSLLLKVLNLPKGSEVLMTSINIPDMPQIVREYGLVPVPVDINLATTAPTLEDLKAVVTERTKILMTSYIYGIIYPIEEIARFCKERGILLVEDAAESYRGNDYCGSPEAIMTMFSFGSIKRPTAFGGALSFIRDPKIYKEMAAIHDSFRVQTKMEFLKKIYKGIAMTLLLNNQTANYTCKRISRLIDFDYKEFVIRNLRGFKSQRDYLEKFNKKPSVALLSMLYYRLANFDKVQFDITNKKLLSARDKLLENGVQVPGYEANNRSFWLFPVVVPDVKLCSEMLNKRGVDAYLGATQLKKLLPPIGPYKRPHKMLLFFDKILYMPISEIVPEEAIEKMVDEIVKVVKIVEKYLTMKELRTKL